MNLGQFTPLRENSRWAVLATLSAVVFGCERANEVEYEFFRLGKPCSSTGYLLWSNDGFAPTDREALVKEIRRLQALENKPHIDKNVEIFLAKGFHDVNVLDQKGDRHRCLLLLAV